MANQASGTAFRGSKAWLQLVVVLVVLGIGWYSSWQRTAERPAQQRSLPRADTKAPERDEWSRDRERTLTDDAGASADSFLTSRSRIPQQTIRDESGEVAFRGTIDVGPTLARISRGQRLGFSHDGSVFQNRERRLPQKPAGYYHEYVHPTPGLDGPGPQRIVRGETGETFYTPDHYRTFQRLDE